MTSDPIITVADIRRLYCVKGARRVIESFGIDFASFMRDGARASQLRGRGYDGHVERVVESMRARHENT